MTATEAHIHAQARLRVLAQALVLQAWSALPAYNEQQVPVFLARAAPIVTAAQRQSVAITDAYIARALERQPLGLDPAAVIAATRAGTSPADVYRRPFVTVWTMLQDGARWEDAVKAGRDRAVSSAATDVQLAMRQTLQTAAQTDRRIVGYARVPDAGACSFCRLVAGQRYTRHDLMPVHSHCGCGVQVITAANRHEFTGNPASDLPAGVAVEQHGELGPVLVDPAQHFTKL